MEAEQVEARKIADRIEMGRTLFLRRQAEDKEKQDMLNASLHEQLARGRERRTAEARDRLYAAHLGDDAEAPFSPLRCATACTRRTPTPSARSRWAAGSTPRRR